MAAADYCFESSYLLLALRISCSLVLLSCHDQRPVSLTGLTLLEDQRLCYNSASNVHPGPFLSLPLRVRLFYFPPLRTRANTHSARYHLPCFPRHRSSSMSPTISGWCSHALPASGPMLPFIRAKLRATSRSCTTPSAAAVPSPNQRRHSASCTKVRTARAPWDRSRFRSI